MALGPEPDSPRACLWRGGRMVPAGGLGWLLSCMSEEAEELERAHQGGPVVRMASFLGMVATKLFPCFSIAATALSRSVMKTCNYRAGPGWEHSDLLVFLPRYTESRPGQCRKWIPLPCSFPHGPTGCG